MTSVPENTSDDARYVRWHRTFDVTDLDSYRAAEVDILISWYSDHDILRAMAELADPEYAEFCNAGADAQDPRAVFDWMIGNTGRSDPSILYWPEAQFTSRDPEA